MNPLPSLGDPADAALLSSPLARGPGALPRQRQPVSYTHLTLPTKA